MVAAYDRYQTDHLPLYFQIFKFPNFLIFLQLQAFTPQISEQHNRAK